MKQGQDTARILAGNESTYALVAAIEAKDPYIRGHSAGVARIAIAIAQEMGLSEPSIEALRAAAILHDVGKISIPGEILNKPGKLGWAEWQLVKTHVTQGQKILSEANFPNAVKAAVAQHHERLDGSGYPLALRGNQIVLEARILAVADVFEAMTSHRPYRPAASREEAITYISENAGIKFDAAVVDAFLRILTRENNDILPNTNLPKYSYAQPANPEEKKAARSNVRRVLRRRIIVRKQIPSATGKSPAAGGS